MPFQRGKKSIPTFWLHTQKHMKHSHMYLESGGMFYHTFVMQFSHSHNDVKSKPTDVSAKTLRSPTAKHLYIWEVLMCDINILPSKATMYTRMSKAISVMCTQKHTHTGTHVEHTLTVQGVLGHLGKGDSPSPSQLYRCLKWENILHTTAKEELFLPSSLKIIIYF